MKKIFLNEAEKRKIIAEKEKAIMESFAKTYNKIKRVDENEISNQRPQQEWESRWEGEWNRSPKDMAIIRYFNKEMSKDVWEYFKAKYSDDIKIALELEATFKKKYGSMYEDNSAILAKHIMAGFKSSVKEIDGEDYEKLSREVQYDINPYQEQPELSDLGQLTPDQEKIKEEANGTMNENELSSFAQGISQKYKLRLLPNPMDVVQASQKYKESKGNFGGNFEGIMTYDPSSSVVVVLSKNEKAGEEVFNEFKKFNANDVGYESFGITVDGYKFPLNTQPSTEEKAFVKSFKIN